MSALKLLTGKQLHSYNSIDNRVCQRISQIDVPYIQKKYKLKMEPPHSIQFDIPHLPVLRDYQAVILGGSFGGISAALALSRAAHSVVLVEHRTYLGAEITARLRPWLPAWDRKNFPELLQSCLQSSSDPGGISTVGEMPLHLDALKLHLENLLLQAGVRLIYASSLVGIDQQEGNLSGVIIGNKSGRQFLPCRLLIDATGTATAARLSGQPFEPAPPTARCTRTLEFDGVDHSWLSGSPQQDEGRGLVFHPGARSGLVWVECSLDLPGPGMDGFSLARREVAARFASLQIVAELKVRLPAFQSAYLSGSSPEVHGLRSPQLAAATAAPWTRGFEKLTLEGPGGKTLPAVPFAGWLRGTWYLNEAIRLEEVDPLAFSDPVFTSWMGSELGSFLAQHWEQAAAPVGGEPACRVHSTSKAGQALQVREPESPQRGYPYPRREVDAAEITVVRQVEVLVVGGGTSGATAAITCAQEGVKTLLVEMNLGLGGTGTLGGVHSYWYGRRIGFSQRVSGWVEQAHRFIHHKEPRGSLGRWNIEAKSFALLKEAEAAGVELLLDASVIGAVMDGDEVRGVVAATRTGPVALLARVVIDASGDGDLAAFAGAAFHYGSARDHRVMWYSLAQFARPGLTQNNFTSTVDVSNIEDYTRAILAGRRRTGKNGAYDHGTYLATRESRHILGEQVLTLTDQLLRRAWSDVVQIAFSNHDVKGHTSSDWVQVGLIPPNLEIEIPYSALLPRGLENLLVVGKAISATHDALPAIRMQADLENLGGVAGLAAAQAVREIVPPRKIQIRKLQGRLVEAQILPAEILTRRLEPRVWQEAELRRLVEQVQGDQPLYEYSNMDLDEVYQGRLPLVELCCAGPRAVPFIEEALEKSSGEARVNLARAAALTGSRAGVPVLVETLLDLLQGDNLPAREAHIHNTQLPPDQGAMPEAAYLLYTMGLTPDRRAFPVWERIAALLERVSEADFYDDRKGTFYYIDAFCAGCERSANPELVPLLKKLADNPALSGNMVSQGFQADFVQERIAYLEVVTGRALARCGSVNGYLTLLDYLQDARALLAEHAHSELAAISGVDLGKDLRAWVEWIEANEGRLTPALWQEPTEAQRAWEEKILTAAEA